EDHGAGVEAGDARGTAEGEVTGVQIERSAVFHRKAAVLDAAVVQGQGAGLDVHGTTIVDKRRDGGGAGAGRLDVGARVVDGRAVAGPAVVAVVVEGAVVGERGAGVQREVAAVPVDGAVVDQVALIVLAAGEGQGGGVGDRRGAGAADD